MNGGTLICVGNFELPDKNAAAHRVVNNAKLFRSIGYRTVFLGACRDADRFEGLARREDYEGFAVYERAYPVTARQWASQMFDLKDLISLTQRYADTAAIVFYNAPYTAVRRACGYFPRRGIRILYDCTEWNDFTEGSFLKKKVKSLDSILIENYLPELCSGMIVVSRTMQARYEKNGGVLLLPPLIDKEDAVWRQERHKEDRFCFCYAGSPSDKERLDLLLAAFSAFPEGKAMLKIIGVTEKEYRTRLPDEGSDLPRDVVFYGRLSHNDAVREILGCDCFVFLREKSRRNTAGFPTKFVEAFTCGVPVITTEVSDVPLYADADCTVLPDASADDLFDAMKKTYNGLHVNRALKETFDYRKYEDDCRRWSERVLCRND